MIRKTENESLIASLISKPQKNLSDIFQSASKYSAKVFWANMTKMRWSTTAPEMAERAQPSGAELSHSTGHELKAKEQWYEALCYNSLVQRNSNLWRGSTSSTSIPGWTNRAGGAPDQAQEGSNHQIQEKGRSRASEYAKKMTQHLSIPYHPKSLKSLMWWLSWLWPSLKIWKWRLTSYRLMLFSSVQGPQKGGLWWHQLSHLELLHQPPLTQSAAGLPSTADDAWDALGVECNSTLHLT